MKPALPCLVLAVLAAGVQIRAQREPNFGKDVLVVLEYAGKEAKTLWDADDENLADVTSDRGEVLEASPFGVSLVRPGEPDPTRDGFHQVADGKALLVFRLREPKQPIKAVARFVATYELLSGGKEHWIDVPCAKLSAAKPWKHAALAEAGFELTHEVREVPQLHVRIAGNTYDVNDVKVKAGGADLENTGSDFDDEAIVYPFDLKDADPKALTLRLELSNGSVVEIEKLPAKKKFARVKNKALDKAGVAVEVRQATAREVFAEGPGDFGLLRGYRWVDKRGKDLGLTPTAQSSGGPKSVKTSCRVDGAPKGAKLQLGVLAGAKWETKSLELADVRVR